jgi:hypothetical protein
LVKCALTSLPKISAINAAADCCFSSSSRTIGACCKSKTSTKCQVRYMR